MMTPGNPLSLLSPPSGQGAKPRKRQAAGKIGHWTIYEVKHGGMGDIYICGVGEHSAEFALKSFQPRLFFDPESRRAFLREVTIWLRLTGTPFIMPALGIEEHEGRFFVLMPAVEEDSRRVGTVSDLIVRKSASPVEAFTVAWQLAMGMKLVGDAIQGVSHGDLKPGNILYNGGPVLISDFGLAAIGRVEGKPLRATPGYEAPEYVSTGPTPAADMYSFGMIVSELAESCPGPKTSFFRRRSASESSPMIRTLTEMAEACRAREPQVRPTFADVVRKLGEAVLAHPDSLRDMFLKTGMLHGGFREMQASMLPDIAEGLLKIDAPAQALEVLDSIKEEERSNKVFVLKGTSLSLLDRDQEALAWFQRALKNPMEDRERLNCLSEYALSLKRVGRLKEAEEIYSDLLRKAKESQLAQIVVNLASVYSEGKEHQKAADLLLKFVRTHQNEPLAYATLGNAYAALGRFQEAAPQYQQALFLAPNLANIQVAFARICLQELGRWEDANEALFAAHQQGFMSREWVLLALVASALTGRAKDAEALMDAAKRDLPDAEAESLEKEAMDMMMATIKKAVVEPNSPEKATHSAAREAVQSAEPAPAPDELPDTAPVIGEATISSGPTFEPAGLPFFNVRFYMPENRFSFDFYDDLGHADYVTRFLESLNMFKRDPQFSRDCELRPTPVFFHECPNCKVFILTNRDEGSNLNCRQCDEKHPTRRVQNERTKQLWELVHQALSKTLTSHKGLRQFLLFQPVEDSPQELEEMKHICKKAGFEHFAGASSPLGFFCIVSLKKAGLPVDPRREIVTVSKLGISDELSYEGETPVETDRLVRELRAVAPIRSMSTNFDPSGTDPASLFFGGKTEEMEQQCRRRVEEAPEDMVQVRLLIEILRGSKKGVEAKSFALRATVSAPDDADSWVALGESEKDLGEYPAAISHLNKALSIDPLKRDALVALFLCYEKTDDKEHARETRSRIEALGGPMLLG